MINNMAQPLKRYGSVSFYLLTVYLCAKSLQLCPTLCDPMGGSLLNSSVHRILQARIPEWVPISSSRGCS